MQFKPARRDIEQALLKARPEPPAPGSAIPDIKNIHNILLNTPIPPEILEINRAPKPVPKPQPEKPKPQRDILAELRQIQKLPPTAEGPKRGVRTKQSEEAAEYNNYDAYGIQDDGDNEEDAA